jgi:hypothetical protein
MLESLIPVRVGMFPRENEAGRFYEFSGIGTLQPVVAGAAHKVASPAGHEALGTCPLDVLAEAA